jgi:hypothetical protein
VNEDVVWGILPEAEILDHTLNIDEDVKNDQDDLYLVTLKEAS